MTGRERAMMPAAILTSQFLRIVRGILAQARALTFDVTSHALSWFCVSGCSSAAATHPPAPLGRRGTNAETLSMKPFEIVGLPPDELSAFLSATHPDPFRVLGPHRVGDDLAIGVFRPDAQKVEILTNGDFGPADRGGKEIHRDGLFLRFFGSRRESGSRFPSAFAHYRRGR